MMVEDGKEMLVKLRFFYPGVVYSMKDRMEVENETPGRGSLERRERCWETKENLLMIRGSRVSGGGEKGKGDEIFGISPRRGHSVLLKCSPPPIPPQTPRPPLMWASASWPLNKRVGAVYTYYKSDPGKGHTYYQRG